MDCNHRSSWIVGGGNGEWCYVCGAYRGMESAYGKGIQPRTVWIKPTGNEPGLVTTGGTLAEGGIFSWPDPHDGNLGEPTHW